MNTITFFTFQNIALRHTSKDAEIESKVQALKAFNLNFILWSICIISFLDVKAQNVGIGTNTPQAPLQVHSNTTYAGGITPVVKISDNFKTWNIGLGASGDRFSIASEDLVERFTILKTNGNVGIGTNTPHTSALLHVDLGSSLSQGLLVTGAQNSSATVPNLGAGTRLMFYPGMAAFRAGIVMGSQWDDENTGLVSVAMGFSTTASGVSSSAMGYYTSASGFASTAMGNYTIASGGNSTAMGIRTTSKAFAGVSIGYYNDDDDAPSGSSPSDFARIFQIGNGTASNRSNAMTVLGNGNTGIGVLNPTHRLEVAGRMRIRSGGTGPTSAGVWLNKNDNSGQLGFIGVDGSNDIGIFNQTSGWSFLVRDATGNAWVKGTVTANGVTLTSDARLKKDITRLGNAMPLLEKLHGYQYHWKDETADTGLQTGLLAQEVEQVMPELVMTDEKGMKSVNYMGIIPYLLEAAKEQQALNRMQQQQIEELKKLVEQLGKK